MICPAHNPVSRSNATRWERLKIVPGGGHIIFPQSQTPSRCNVQYGAASRMRGEVWEWESGRIYRTIVGRLRIHGNNPSPNTGKWRAKLTQSGVSASSRQCGRIAPHVSRLGAVVERSFMVKWTPSSFVLMFPILSKVLGVSWSVT